MSLGDAETAWANRMEWAQEGHVEECNCEKCHEYHKEEGIVYELSQGADHECCREEIRIWVDKGEFCLACKTGAYMDQGTCLECEENRRKKESH